MEGEKYPKKVDKGQRREEVKMRRGERKKRSWSGGKN
jgi:hypothetical protein